MLLPESYDSARTSELQFLAEYFGDDAGQDMEITFNEKVRQELRIEIEDLLTDWSAETGLHELFDQQRECDCDPEKERQGKITSLTIDKREMLSVSAKSC